MNTKQHRGSRILRRAAVAVALGMVLVSMWPGSVTAQRRPRTPQVPAAPTVDPDGGWRLQAAAQTNLWFHAMAVIAADQPGPLVKQERGVYPTTLDSLAPKLRADIGDGRNLETLHFVPLYFPRAGPEQMLGALRAVAKRRTGDEQLAAREVQFGAFVVGQTLQKGSERRLLEALVDVMEREWEVFYRDYWEERQAEAEARSDAMQEMWDSAVAPQLADYLERRRLTAGIVMPSPALGPEGRIVDVAALDPSDQVVAVQEPLSATGPDAAVFAFVKELCFLLLDDALPGEEEAATVDEREDLRRRAAVRCGALLLEFYAPAQVARYRRVFLDAVGAEESATVAAFERVYDLDPAVFRRIREQIQHH